MALEWSPIFSVGVPELDRDHMALMAMINEIENKIGSGYHLGAMIEKYCGEMARHAAREVAVLERYGYAGHGEMATAHATLVTQFENFRAAAASGEVARTAKAWLEYQSLWISVLTSVSMDYRRYFVANRIVPVVDP
ncbi:conserved protein of unknown function（containing Haemerythrin-like, metal-binding domain,2-104;2-119) [Magnetospirillum sp. XM-1]|uniref:hypothetical protein n=1 Tax=Magnetospirillum sp. XM-1 TaxID=1663591 RepID=UPI00073DDF3F|nr:hypothetical protein [Magnetospirillum sp. XM-1]CUW40919.1 conserved protein of unknown function\